MLTLILSLVSCSNEVDFKTYQLKFNPVENQINFNGTWVQNMDDSGNVLNRISIRPYEDYFLVFSDEKIGNFKVVGAYDYKIERISSNCVKVLFINQEWFAQNQNSVFQFTLYTY